jgi:hypothetical protein
MGVGDHDHKQARVAVEAEAKDNTAEVEHVGIFQGIGPITCSSKWGCKRVYVWE